MDRAALVALPKAELHVHLELSIAPHLAEEFAAARGMGQPDRGPWPDQATFVRECEQVRDLIGSLDDLSRVAEALVVAADRQGIWWTEVTCAPFNYGGALGPEEGVVEAVLDGLRTGCRSTGRGAGVILAHNRGHEAGIGRRVLALCERFRAGQDGDPGVVALGLVGDEAGYPPELFVELFTEAREHGVNRVPHAGEADGPAAIRRAWLGLDAQRIAHGARAAESPELVAELAGAEVCLDLCPSSNVALHAAPSLAEHQLPRLRAAGVPVSVGSDCTYLMGVDLLDEYAALETAMGLNPVQIAGVARDSLRHSFAPGALVVDALADWERWCATRLP